jgi:general secretion pathway protein C
MKKRLPLLFSLLAVIALSASIAFWAMALYKPKQRPLAAIVEAPMPEPVPDAAATLFGGQASTAVASNYQLTGVVSAGREGVAILVADGQPPRAVQVGKEVVAGVLLREVHPKYVMLADGGMLKRIELATDAKAGTSMALAPPVGIMNQGAQQMQGPPPETNVPVPPPQPGQPMEVPQAQQQNQPMEVPQALPPGVPPPPPPSMNMPAPTRSMGGQGGQPPPTQ